MLNKKNTKKGGKNSATNFYENFLDNLGEVNENTIPIFNNNQLNTKESNTKSKSEEKNYSTSSKMKIDSNSSTPDDKIPNKKRVSPTTKKSKSKKNKIKYDSRIKDSSVDYYANRCANFDEMSVPNFSNNNIMNTDTNTFDSYSIENNSNKEEINFDLLSIEECMNNKNTEHQIAGYKKIEDLLKENKGNTEIYNKYIETLKLIPFINNPRILKQAISTLEVYLDTHTDIKSTIEIFFPNIVKKLLCLPRFFPLGEKIGFIYIDKLKDLTPIYQILNEGYKDKKKSVVSGTINFITKALQEFGDKIINIEYLQKHLETFFMSTDIKIRKSAQLLALEMYKYGGEKNLNFNLLKKLKESQIYSLKNDISKLKAYSSQPKRRIANKKDINIKEIKYENEDIKDTKLENIDISKELNIDDVWIDKLSNGKWQEKKEKLDKIINKVQHYHSIDMNSVISKIINAISILLNDLNINVVLSAMNTIFLLSEKLKSKYKIYACKQYYDILKKFKSSKCIKVAHDILYSFYCYSFNLEFAHSEIVKNLHNKMPKVREQTLIWITKCAKYESKAKTLNKFAHDIKNEIVNLFEDSSLPTRNQALTCFGTLLNITKSKIYFKVYDEFKSTNLRVYKHLEVIVSVSNNIKNLQMMKNRSYTLKFKPLLRKKTRLPVNKYKTLKKNEFMHEKIKFLEKEENKDLLALDNKMNKINIHKSKDEEPIKLNKIIPMELMKNLNNKKDWQIRSLAINEISLLIDEQTLPINSDLEEFGETLRKRLTDNNIFIVNSVIILLGKLGNCIVEGLNRYSKTLFVGLLKLSSSSNKQIRKNSRESIGIWIENIGIKHLIKHLMILFTNINNREYLLETLIKYYDNDVEKRIIYELFEKIIKCLQDKKNRVRLLSEKMLELVINHVGLNEILTRSKKLSNASQLAIKPILHKYKNDKKVEKNRIDSETNNDNNRNYNYKKEKFLSRFLKVKTGVNNNKKDLLYVNNRNNLIDIKDLKSDLSKLLNNEIYESIFSEDYRENIKIIKMMIDNINFIIDFLTEHYSLIFIWISYKLNLKKTELHKEIFDFLNKILRELKKKNMIISKRDLNSLFPTLIKTFEKIINSSELKLNVINALNLICHISEIDLIIFYHIESLSKYKENSSLSLSLKCLNYILENIKFNVSSVFKDISSIVNLVTHENNEIANKALDLIELIYKSINNGDIWNLMLNNKFPEKQISLIDIKLNKYKSYKKNKSDLYNVKNLSNNNDFEMNFQLPDVFKLNLDKLKVKTPKPLNSEISKSLLDILESSSDITTVNKSNELMNDINKDNKKEEGYFFKESDINNDETSISLLNKPSIKKYIEELRDNTDINSRLNVISSAYKFLKTEMFEFDILDNLDDLIEVLSEIILEGISKAFDVNQQLDQTFKWIINSLLLIVDKYKSSYTQLKENSLKEIFRSFICFLSCPFKRNTSNTSSNELNKLLEILILKIIKNSNDTVLLCAFINLTKEIFNPKILHLDISIEKFISFLIKLITKKLTFIDKTQQINYKKILNTCQEIINYIKTKKFLSNKIIKIKKDIHNIIRATIYKLIDLDGKSVMLEIELFDKDTFIREIAEKYFIVKTEHLDELPNKEDNTINDRKENIDNNILLKRLDSIFERLQRSSTANQAMKELKLFIKEHPDIDIQRYINKTSDIIQNYIKSELFCVDQEKYMYNDEMETKEDNNDNNRKINKIGINKEDKKGSFSMLDIRNRMKYIK